MKTETYTYKTVGGCHIKSDIYRTPVCSGAAPVIVYIHGGALIFGSRRGINQEQLALYLEAGYTVVSIDYRLAPESKLPDIIEDLQDALHWIRTAGPCMLAIDPQRMVVVGHSAGGYLALMTGCCVSPPPSAIVAFYGYGDIIGDWYRKPDPHYCRQPAVPEREFSGMRDAPAIAESAEGRDGERFYLYCRQQGLWPLEVGGRDPQGDPGFFNAYCPLRNIRAGYPPTLLLHGEQDSDVPFEQSALMSGELARHGVKHELLALPGRDHGFDGQMDDPVVRDAFGRVLRFLRKHTRSVLECPPDVKTGTS